MLERENQSAAVMPQCEVCQTDWDQLSCHIDVPHEWRSEFEKEGPLGTIVDDTRRFPRFHYHVRAVLHYRRTLPALARPHGHYVVLTRNVSREGVCFLHEEELFPGERLSMDLPDNKVVDVEISRCRKINGKCFEIGGRITTPLH